MIKNIKYVAVGDWVLFAGKDMNDEIGMTCREVLSVGKKIGVASAHAKRLYLEPSNVWAVYDNEDEAKRHCLRALEIETSFRNGVLHRLNADKTKALQNREDAIVASFEGEVL